MSVDPEEDVEAFFRNIKEKLGIEFGDDVTEADDPREAARRAMEEHDLDIPEDPPVTLTEEVVEEERYPGSKQALTPVKVESEDDGLDEPWDTHPRIYTTRGTETEFFPISALATALRRKTVTVRKWEQKGYLPKAQFRSPGGGEKQDRLYTREQIEGLLRIAREEKLLEPRKKMRIDQTDFPNRAHRLFAKLAERSN